MACATRPLDAPKSEKWEGITGGQIKDPLYVAPMREEIMRCLIEAAVKAIARWEAILGQVGREKGFELPSYEAPPPPVVVIPVEPPTKQVTFYTHPDELATPPWEKRVSPSTSGRP
jgi:hypothetical protein